MKLFLLKSISILLTNKFILNLVLRNLISLLLSVAQRSDTDIDNMIVQSIERDLIKLGYLSE